MSCQCGGEGEKAVLNELLEKYTQDQSNLIQILNEVQEKYGYIPKVAQLEIADYLSIPLAEV